MTTYTWNGTPGTSSDWNTPANWLGGVVPDTADANVIFPTITYAADGTAAYYYVSVAAGGTISIGALSLAGDLTIAGELDIAGAAAFAQNGTFDLTGGTVRLGSLNVIAGTGILGSGTIASAGTVTNAGVIGGPGLVVSAASFDNLGTLNPGVQLNLTNGAAGFGNLSGGMLSGGFIDAGDGTLVLPANPGGIVAISNSVALSTDAIVLTVTPSGTVSLLSTLQTIAAGGTLTLEADGTTGVASVLSVVAAGGSLSFGGGSYSTPNTLDVEGQVTTTSTLATAGLVIGATGLVHGSGQIVGPISGTGTLDGAFLVGNAGAVTLEIDYGTLEVTGSASGTATFANLPSPSPTGIPLPPEVIRLDNPASFTGTIEALQTRYELDGQRGGQPNIVPDAVMLPGLTTSDVLSKTYTGTAQGGTLTLQTANSTIALRFAGQHQLSDFKLALTPQTYSNSPQNLLVEMSYVELTGTAPVFEFYNLLLGEPIYSTQSNAVVTFGALSDQAVTLLGTHETVSLLSPASHQDYGPYNDVVLGPQGGSTVTLGAGFHAVVLSGAGNTVTIGNGGTTPGIVGALSYVNAGTGLETVTAGNGTDVINTGGYGDVITVGSGLNLIFATDGSGAASNPSLGAAGHTTLALGSGNNFAYLHGAENRIIEGGGVDAVWGGTGGGDSFVLAASGGALFVENFGASDTLDLTKILAGAPLAADLSNLASFISVAGYGADDRVFGVDDGGSKTVLQVLGGSGTQFVNLENVGSLTVAGLLAQNALMLPSH